MAESDPALGLQKGIWGFGRLDCLKLLFWLKWMLTWRGMRRSRFKLLSSIFLLCIFGPLCVLFAWGINALYGAVSPSDAAFVTRDVLAVLFVIWVVTPLFGFQLNESFDLTKLFVYPVGLGVLFAGSVLGGVLDLPVLFTLPAFVIIVAYYAHSFLAAVVTVLALCAFFLHTLALGQALVLTQVGFLRSRKYRDISIVIFPVLGMGYTIMQQFFVRQFNRGADMQFFAAPMWHAADWLAPGFCVKVLDGMRTQNYGSALAGAFLLLIAGAISVLLAVWALRMLYFGDSSQGRVAQPSVKTVRPIFSSLGPLRFLPSDISAMAGKEMAYIEREPQYKMLVIQLLCVLAVIAVPFLTNYTATGMRLLIAQHNAFAFYSLSSLLMFWMMPIIFNHYAGEGAAITVLFALPTRRRAMILGKNIAHFAMMLVLNWTGLIALSAVTGVWAPLPAAMLLVLGCGPVLLAIGNLVSIYLPHRMLMRGNRPQPSGLSAADGTGCAYAVLYLLAYAAAGIVVSPIVAAVVLPALLGAPLYYLATIPLSFGYSALLYTILLGESERRLMGRESEISVLINPSD